MPSCDPRPTAIPLSSKKLSFYLWLKLEMSPVWRAITGAPMDQEERRSLHVFVPAFLVRRAKALAAIEDREVADVVAVALSRYLVEAERSRSVPEAPGTSV